MLTSHTSSGSNAWLSIIEVASCCGNPDSIMSQQVSHISCFVRMTDLVYTELVVVLIGAMAFVDTVHAFGFVSFCCGNGG